ncbi:Maf family protein [Patulibacter defluvii]|uniref:Maf family protein n=1 Tax=Patulibacter defluvii TaxID=3095358 RepID=UPI002A758996|nr:Maf family protein [Patulibacter sp. DM4]
MSAPLVLASRSPQRRAILETLSVPFRVRVSDVEERTDGEPIAVAIENARRKALAVADGEPPGTLVLGADTVIVDDLGEATAAPRAVGKPADAAEAAAMLRRWSGRGHHVASSAAVVRAGADGGHETLLAEADTTLVRFRTLSERELAWYVATEEWRERAGGYAIQLRGTLLVDAIEGDWWTVVGLPVALLARRAPALLRHP